MSCFPFLLKGNCIARDKVMVYMACTLISFLLCSSLLYSLYACACVVPCIPLFSSSTAFASPSLYVVGELNNLTTLFALLCMFTVLLLALAKTAHLVREIKLDIAESDSTAPNTCMLS